MGSTLSEDASADGAEKGRRSLGIMRRIRLPQRVYKVLERKTMRAGLSPRCRQHSNYARDLRLRSTPPRCKVILGSLTGPLPQQRQVKTATHKMQDDQVVVSTVRSSRRVSIFCQRLDGAEPNNGKAMKLCQTMTSLEVTVTTRRNKVCARINIRSTQESRRD